ncbi:hypothetical protein [Tropicibacter sp. S64]|uniref:hypothetical protein n=1 Tax=Tropicibacter sp. S64 TaxID=3415122 RepID=UPI003C7DE108
MYAKTDRRVRFEILLESTAIEKITGARGANRFQSIAQKLGDLRAHAALKLNEVLPILNQGPPTPSTATALQLISEIQRASPDHHLAEMVVSALVAFGRIAPLNNDPLRETVDRLKKSGLLEPIKPRSRVCIVSNQYRLPLEQLRQLLACQTPLAPEKLQK